jgi:tetratricopeptide (TPR) repeat protein
MKSKSKLKDFLNDQLSDAEEQQIMDQLFRYEFEQLLTQELELHKANALTDLTDNPAVHTPVIIALQPPIPKKWYLSPISWGIAASTILAILMVPFMMKPHHEAPKIAANFDQFIDKQPMPTLITTLGTTVDEAETRQLAKSNYKTENYQKAASEYQQLVETDRYRCTKEDCFYGALSFMAKQNPTPNYPKAINYLKKAINISHGWNLDEMHFYLAVALYKNKQLKEAKDLFEQIANHPGEYQTKVKENLKNFPNE